MRYLPQTEEEVAAMLAAVGVPDVDALFDTVPGPLRLGRLLDLPPSLGEADLIRHLEELAAKNDLGGATPSFLGGGLYHHYIPSAVDHLISRSEFYTAYTPYQPEVSQGTLQATFEFQSMVAAILGMDVANSSLYDGATATAEGALLARRVKRRDRVVVSGAVHPEYRQVLESYLKADVITIPHRDGASDVAGLGAAALEAEAACIIVQHPNFLGVVEDVAAVAEQARAAGALLVVTTADPTVFGVLRSPGDLGADVVTGEGQALGVPVSFGGPALGLFACRQQFLRQIPGRLVGRTADTLGRTGYVLTLSTREQHIRRERATSNICTNQGLCALAATVYMALMGPGGLEGVARRCHSGAEHLKRLLADVSGVELAHAAPTFHEFVLRLPGRDAAALVSRIHGESGLHAGVPLGRFDAALSDQLLVTVTELHRLEDLEVYVSAIRRALASA
jgi:glycine dehydrogenase subunit 1